MRTLLDTITPGVLRGTPLGDAYAGYVGGHWPDADAIRRDFPNHLFVSIAVFADEDADFCDCEPGDLAPSQVAPWLLRQHRRGVWRPGVYANASTLPTVLAEVTRVLPRSMYRVWGASWNGERNLPSTGNVRWDAHQYADHGPNGENYDMSVVADDFFPVARPPAHPHLVARAKLTTGIEWDTKRRAWKLDNPVIAPEPWGHAD